MSDKLLQNFLLGGFVVSITSYTVTFVDPIMGSIICSYPISILPIIYYMKTNGKTNKNISNFLFNTTFALLILMITTWVIGYFLKHTHEQESIWPSIIKSNIVWLLFGVMYYYIFSQFPQYEAHHFLSM